MANKIYESTLDGLKRPYTGKFIPEERVFSYIHPGDRIFIGTGCGEPQYVVRFLIEYVRSQPNAFYDAEVLLENTPMLPLFEKACFIIERRAEAGVYELTRSFR